jgi:hypothetical protein
MTAGSKQRQKKRHPDGPRAESRKAERSRATKGERGEAGAAEDGAHLREL